MLVSWNLIMTMFEISAEGKDRTYINAPETKMDISESYDFLKRVQRVHGIHYHT